MIDLKAQQAKLKTLIAQRDAMFSHLAKRLASLDVAAIRNEEVKIEAISRSIAGMKAAVTRAGGNY